MKSIPTLLGIPKHIRKMADKLRKPRCESLAGYVRRLIIEDNQRNESTTGNS